MKRNPDTELDTQVTPLVPALEVLRDEIDSIDDSILQLLERRYAVVRRVSRAKAGDSATALPLRPLRERQIVERLSTLATHVPAADIAHVWRAILSLSAQSQRAHKVVLWGPEGARVALTALAAGRFGPTVPTSWAHDADEAIAAARRGDSILLIPADHLQPSKVADLDLIGQYPLDCLHHPWAVAMGMLAAEAEAPLTGWSPSSWQRQIHHQLPAYPDSRMLGAVETQLASAEPVVTAEDAAALTTELVEAQRGRRLVIQAGECAEPIDASRGETLAMRALLHDLGDRLEQDSGMRAIRLGRMAGQFAKPRSGSAEQAGGATLAVYRGDAVNQAGASVAERAADPARLHDAYAQSYRVARWLGEDVPQVNGERRQLFISHEALLLNYEAALTRQAADGRWWARSGHSLWLGDRTRDPHGAHVEYLRGIANSIGIKCGPSVDPADLVALLDRIDPARTPGRIMLVARLGHEAVADRLGAMMEEVRSAEHPVLWLCDPMHGNNRSVDGVKTRLVPEIVAEVEQFAAIACSLGIHPGGLHLEITPDPVGECVDELAEAHSLRHYLSRCDPRLNPGQAMHVVDRFAAALEGAR